MNSQEMIQAGYKVQRLVENDDFIWLLGNLRESHIADFVSSAADESDKREEAHAMLRCLAKVETRIKVLTDQGNRARRKQDEQERV